MYENYESNRRQFLKTIGPVSAACVVPAMSAKAATIERHGGTQRIGITDEVTTLLRNGNGDKAEQLLQQHDIKYDRATVTMPAVGSQQASNKGFTTQSEYSKKRSLLDHTTYHLKGKNRPVYHSNLHWVLKGAGIDGPGPVDGAGITYSGDYWELESGSYTMDSQSTLDKRGHKGAIVDFDDVNAYNAAGGRGSGYFGVNIEKTEPGTHNVYGTYIHTWAVGGVPSGGASFGLSAGPITVSPGAFVDTWTKRNDNET